MPVGTNATVKAVPPEDLQAMGFKIILANTYHLYLRPGHELIRKAGGLHGFSGWRGNFLTDSGGFQVFSLAPFRKIVDEGVKFRSHIDGSSHFLTPEKIVDIQTAFNSDIQMQLDVCAPWGETDKKAWKAMMLTLEWGRKAKVQWEKARSEGYQGKLLASSRAISIRISEKKALSGPSNRISQALQSADFQSESRLKFFLSTSNIPRSSCRMTNPGI